MLRNRSIAALLAAELISTTGSQLTFLALPWFVLVTTGSATQMSVVLAVEILPMALFGIPSGSVVARLGGRRTMLLSDALRAPLILLVPVLHALGRLSFPVLLLDVFLLGLFFAPYLASQRSIVPELVGEDETAVTRVSALFGTAVHLTMIAGPALAGFLIGWLGASTVLAIDAGTYAVAFLLVLTLVRAGARAAQTEESRGVLAGVRYLARDRLLGPMTLTVIVLDMTGNALFVAMPVLAFTRFHRDPHVAGWLFAAFGLGALVGGLVAMKLAPRIPATRLIGAAVICAALPLWALVATLPAAGVGLVMFASGLFVPLVNAPAMALITLRPPPELRAKVLTAVLTASALGGPFGRLAAGPMLAGWGPGAAFAVIAGCFSLGAVLLARAALRGGQAPEAVPAAG